MSQSDLPEGFRPGDPTARPRAETEFAAATFSHKDKPGGGFLVLIEEDAPGLSVTKRRDAWISLPFREGVSYEESVAFAERMHELLEGVAYTRFIT